MAEGFLVVETNLLWEMSRLGCLTVALFNLFLMAREVRHGLRDSYTLWCFVGLIGFNVLVAVQALAAWGQDVPLWRFVLAWSGLIYTTLSLWAYVRRSRYRSGGGIELGLRGRDE